VLAIACCVCVCLLCVRVLAVRRTVCAGRVQFDSPARARGAERSGVGELLPAGALQLLAAPQLSAGGPAESARSSGAGWRTGARPTAAQRVERHRRRAQAAAAAAALRCSRRYRHRSAAAAQLLQQRGGHSAETERGHSRALAHDRTRGSARDATAAGCWTQWVGSAHVCFLAASAWIVCFVLCAVCCVLCSLCFVCFVCRSCCCDSSIWRR
jgi:hypothetical protein